MHPVLKIIFKESLYFHPHYILTNFSNSYHVERICEPTMLLIQFVLVDENFRNSLHNNDSKE